MASKAGRPASKPQTIVQQPALDPVSQALTDRYRSQQGQSGNPYGQRSPRLQQQLQDSASTAQGVRPNYEPTTGREP